MHLSDSDTIIVQRLTIYRYEHDLTYDQLADLMASAGYRVKARTLHFILTGRLLFAPRERTLYKIRQYLKVVDTETPTKHRARLLRKRTAA